MQPTTAISRIFGIEPKNRITSTVRIEKEFLEIFSKNRLEKSDTINISIQKFYNTHGIPIIMVALEPEGARVHPLDLSDIINLSLSDLLKSRGILN